MQSRNLDHVLYVISSLSISLQAIHIKEKIGYDDFILNDTALNEYYADVSASQKSIDKFCIQCLYSFTFRCAHSENFEEINSYLEIF